MVAILGVNVGAFSQPDVCHLGKRSDRFRVSLTSCQDTRDEGCGYHTHSRVEENGLPICRGQGWFRHETSWADTISEFGDLR